MKETLMDMLLVFSPIVLLLVLYAIYSRSTRTTLDIKPHPVETYEDGLAEESSSSTQLSLFEEDKQDRI
jgi:hypothetical protein